jgi:hypothetical protein
MSWAMGLVEQFNASLTVDISNVQLTQTELFLLSSVPANDIMASTWHKSQNWFSQGRFKSADKIVLTHDNHDVKNREFELQMYEDETRVDGSVICAVVEIGTSEPIDSVVLIFWNKMRLITSNQGYGLGASPGSYRYDGMRRVL